MPRDAYRHQKTKVAKPRAQEIQKLAAMRTEALLSQLDAAKIDAVDRGYWEREIAPLVDHYPNVEFIGEINEQQKVHFLL